MTTQSETVVRAWGGFCNGRLDIITIDDGFGGFNQDGWRRTFAVFKSRKAAQKQYKDVRRIEIIYRKPTP